MTCDRPAPDLTKCGPAAPMIYGNPAAAADAGPPRNFVFIACKAVRASAVRRTIQ